MNTITYSLKLLTSDRITGEHETFLFDGLTLAQSLMKVAAYSEMYDIIDAHIEKDI